MYDNSMIERVVEWRKSKGFVTSWENMLEKLMLVVTELSEAAEAYRNDDRANFEEEMADTFIRLYDIVGTLGIDIGRAIEAKMAYNETRPYRHGKKRGSA